MTKSRSNATAPNAKGTLVVGSGTDASSTLAVGSANQVLTVDSSTATGLKWAAASSSTPTYVGCAVTASADTTIANTTFTALGWNTEDFDSDGFHDNTTNNSRLTIPSGKAGKYLVTVQYRWDTDANGTRYLYIYKNGTNVKETTWKAQDKLNSNVMSVVLNLAVGDYVQAYVYQDSGGTRTLYNSLAQGQFSASLLGV